MSQSLAKNYIHLVFSTKYRQALITDEIEQELYAYLAGICKKLECHPIKIGGYTDHVHILCMLSKKLPLMKLVEEGKSHSSKWVKTKGQEFENFYWQDGYAAFSVDCTRVEASTRYIARQKEHHRKENFQNELRGILTRYEVEFDERYVWD
jgi:REP element-mobilizing transposase RayT